jgi:hypothetical protein
MEIAFVFRSTDEMEQLVVPKPRTRALTTVLESRVLCRMWGDRFEPMSFREMTMTEEHRERILHRRRFDEEPAKLAPSTAGPRPSSSYAVAAYLSRNGASRDTAEQISIAAVTCG